MPLHNIPFFPFYSWYACQLTVAFLQFGKRTSLLAAFRRIDHCFICPASSCCHQWLQRSWNAASVQDNQIFLTRELSLRAVYMVILTFSVLICSRTSVLRVTLLISTNSRYAAIRKLPRVNSLQHTISGISNMNWGNCYRKDCSKKMLRKLQRGQSEERQHQEDRLGQRQLEIPLVLPLFPCSMIEWYHRKTT